MKWRGAKATLTFAGGKDKYRNFFLHSTRCHRNSRFSLPCMSLCFLLLHNASCYSSCFSLLRIFDLIRFFRVCDTLATSMFYHCCQTELFFRLLFSFIRTLRKQNFTQSKSCATHLHLYHCSSFFSGSVLLYYFLVVVFAWNGAHLISCSKKGYM